MSTLLDRDSHDSDVVADACLLSKVGEALEVVNSLLYRVSSTSRPLDLHTLMDKPQTPRRNGPNEDESGAGP